MKRSPDIWNLSGVTQQPGAAAPKMFSNPGFDAWQEAQESRHPNRLHAVVAPPQAPSQDVVRMSEDEYRAWLTASYQPEFAPYLGGGMPGRVFLELFGQRDLFRNRKLTDLLAQMDANRDGRVTWSEFYSFMTYRKREEVGAARRMLNGLVRSGAPAAGRQERRVRAEGEESGEPVPQEAYLEFYNCRPPPIFVPLVVVAVWVAFLVYLVELNRGPEWNRVTWTGGVPYYSPLCFCPARRQEVWRFLSYMLLHVGWHHIVFNSILTLLLGIPLELVHKAWRVAPIFLAGVLAGSLLSSMAEPAVTLMGASGGVYALIGAHYGLVVMNWEELQEGWQKWRGNPIRLVSTGVFRLLILTLLVALDFGVALYRRYTLDSRETSVSLTAHVAGLLCGLLFGIPCLLNIDKKPWEMVLFWVAIALLLAFLCLSVLWNIFYKGYPTDIPCSGAGLR